jgi:hypothetical protein
VDVVIGDPGELIPRFPVARIIVDPDKQLCTARLFALVPWLSFC